MTDATLEALIDRAEAAEARSQAYAQAILVCLSGFGIPTPEQGYERDGGPGLAALDLKRLRAVFASEFARGRAAGEESGIRWANKMRADENRIRHAIEVLRGEFSPPELDEIRMLRGLEPLAGLDQARLAEDMKRGR